MLLYLTVCPGCIKIRYRMILFLYILHNIDHTTLEQSSACELLKLKYRCTILFCFNSLIAFQPCLYSNDGFNFRQQNKGYTEPQTRRHVFLCAIAYNLKTIGKRSVIHHRKDEEAFWKGAVKQRRTVLSMTYTLNKEYACLISFSKCNRLC